MALAASGVPPKSSSLSASQRSTRSAFKEQPTPPPPILSLQPPHPPRTPAEAFQVLSDACREHDIGAFDVYGDFGASSESSFLRRFERSVSDELGFADAVFMPSGVMAQSIALLVHASSSSNREAASHETSPRQDGGEDGLSTTKEATRWRCAAAAGSGFCFACHESSHLLLHEERAYRELLGMEALVLPSPTADTSSIDSTAPLGALPLDFATVRRELDRYFQRRDGDGDGDNANEGRRRHLSTLILELPHRELGGKATPYEDMLDMRDYCRKRGIRFHCDGARIFEASAAYASHISLRQLVEPFDSLYVSFYKGLGGMSGAMLLGSPDFCAEARVWLRRFGGNLYTLLPYAVSGWLGFRQNWLLLASSGGDADASPPLPPPPLSFVDKKDKMVEIVAALSSIPAIAEAVTFDPEVPQVKMVHGYLRWDPETCQDAVAAVEARIGIRVLVRVRPVDPADPIRRGAHALGYRSYFEWTIGEGNERIPTAKVLEGWSELAKELHQRQPIATSSAEPSA